MTFQELIQKNNIHSDISSIRPLSLAYLGDTVFDLYIRSLLVAGTNQDPHRMHEKATKLVNATSQARLMRMILEILTEEEMTVFRHGRNQRPLSLPKNQSPVDYKVATGLETLLGYLYLKQQEDRILELLEYGLSKVEIGKEQHE